MTVQNNFQDSHATVIKLVERFEKNQHHYLSASYQEQEARKDFLDKFFMALGWDVNHETQTNPYEQEVKIEKSVTTGTAKRRADYSFSLAPHFTKRPRFFVEAKRPQQDIATPDNYFQSIRYSWSHQLPLVVLTDFRSFHIIDSRYRPDIKTALPRKLAVYNYREYRDPDVFAKIYWLFSREATLGDAIGKYADTLEKPTASSKQLGLFAGGYQNIDDAFLGQLDQYREELARSFKRHNPELDSEQLTEVVQRTAGFRHSHWVYRSSKRAVRGGFDGDRIESASLAEFVALIRDFDDRDGFITDMFPRRLNTGKGGGIARYAGNTFSLHLADASNELDSRAGVVRLVEASWPLFLCLYPVKPIERRAASLARSLRARGIPCHCEFSALRLPPGTSINPLCRGEVQGAHIKPDARGGSDRAENGLWLCEYHHQATEGRLSGRRNSESVEVAVTDVSAKA